MREGLALALGMAVAAAGVAEQRPLGAKDEALLSGLERRIEAVAAGFDGALGVAIVDLASGRELLRLADEVFPAASIIKVAVLAELFRQDQAGAGARLDDAYVVDAKDLVPDSAMLDGMTPGVTRLTNRDLASFMIAVSDNAATNVLIDRVGLERVNALLEGLGLRQTRLRRKMLDVAAARAGRENTATPRELARFFAQLQRAEFLDRPHLQGVLKTLSATPRKSFLGLPDGVRSATKWGALEGVRGEAGIVFATGRPFVIVVLTALAGDEARAEAAIAEIGRAAHDVFDRLGRATPEGRVLYPREP
jgi:beta-lactamase class A